MSRAVVASYNREAQSAGIRVLEEGGNAFDAFVAATLAEYVVAPGVTSLAGPLNAVVYHKQSDVKLYLDAEMNHVGDPEGMWSEQEPAGKGIMVPGALHGLESIHRRFGKLPWSRLVQPATALARDGFVIDPPYSATIDYRAEVLKSSPYGKTTFFRHGKPLQPRDKLVQPELAWFLEGWLNGAQQRCIAAHGDSVASNQFEGEEGESICKTSTATDRNGWHLVIFSIAVMMCTAPRVDPMAAPGRCWHSRRLSISTCRAARTIPNRRSVWK